MGKVVSKVFGYDRALNQVEHSVGALQAQGVSTLRDIQGQISRLDRNSRMNLCLK